MFDIIKAPKMICTPFTGCPGKWVHIKKGAFIVYYRCYCPRLVTERGWKRVWHFDFLNSIYRSRCNLSLHLQVARWILPSVTSTKKGGPPPSFFVCVKTCLTLTSFVIYYDTWLPLICKYCSNKGIVYININLVLKIGHTIGNSWWD